MIVRPTSRVTTSGPPSAYNAGSVSLRSNSPSQASHHTKRLSTTSASSLPSSLLARDDKYSEKFERFDALNVRFFIVICIIIMF